MNNAFQRALAEAVQEARAPGAVLFVGESGRRIFLDAAGYAQLEPVRRPARTDTLYDLASLTKVVAATTAILKLRDAGALRLDQSASDFVPIEPLRGVAIEHLLRHTAGFSETNRYYRLVSTADELVSWYAFDGLDAAPGERYRYSDASFVLLAKIVEVAALQPFDVFCANEIFRPLQMRETTFNPAPELAARCAATEHCRWRGRVVVGQVHDENAYAIGGVSGHAGLFSTAEDLGRFCFGLMNGALLDLETVREMTRPGGFAPYPWQALGWHVDPWQTKALGWLPSRTAFGHTGWTGTSIWMDPERQNCVVLLSNTPHPSRRRMRNGPLRKTVHKAVGAALYPDSTNAHSGLDRLMREEFDRIRKSRYAVLTNRAAVDFLGRNILEVLSLAPADCRLVRLFSPEHGLSGELEAGAHVESDRWNGVEVVSLYGGQRAPEPDQLREIDLFLVDLQDVGARYYTYHATMKRCLEACEAAGVPVLVLDRPNPLGGVVLEGPIARDTESIVSAAAIPVRHGMTMGEMALWYKQTEFRRVVLDVLGLDGWTPDRYFEQTSLPWVAPSPNIPSARTALWYVGNCLFEGINLNEGRGTETPFEVIGAPWLNPEHVIAEVPDALRAGAGLEPVTYTPVSMPGKSVDPLYRNIECRGIRFHLADAARLRPLGLALAIIAAARAVHPDRVEWAGQPSFDTLIGETDTRRALEDGLPVEQIVARWTADLNRFDRSRPKLYLEH